MLMGVDLSNASMVGANTNHVRAVGTDLPLGRSVGVGRQEPAQDAALACRSGVG